VCYFRHQYRLKIALKWLHQQARSGLGLALQNDAQGDMRITDITQGGPAAAQGVLHRGYLPKGLLRVFWVFFWVFLWRYPFYLGFV
jgi:hypothetical protein